MGWLYIIIRTYPFWAIPLGVALIFGPKKRAKVPKKRLLLIRALGVILIGTSIAFITIQGHESAVPFVHELLRGQRP